MKEYTVDLCYRAWDQQTVMANSEEEALEKANNAQPDYKYIKDTLDRQPEHDSARLAEEI